MEENEEEIGKGGGKIIAEKGVNKRLAEREGRGREMEGKREIRECLMDTPCGSKGITVE